MARKHDAVDAERHTVYELRQVHFLTTSQFTISCMLLNNLLCAFSITGISRRFILSESEMRTFLVLNASNICEETGNLKV